MTHEPVIMCIPKRVAPAARAWRYASTMLSGGTPNLASLPPSTLDGVSESVRPTPGFSRKLMSSGKPPMPPLPPPLPLPLPPAPPRPRPRSSTSVCTSDTSSRLMMAPKSHAKARSLALT